MCKTIYLTILMTWGETKLLHGHKLWLFQKVSIHNFAIIKGLTEVGAQSVQLAKKIYTRL